VPERAKRIAFARDKTRGKVSGVTVEDVVEAVTGIFEENKDLDHSMSLMEFVQNELAKADAADRKNMN
jgi:Mg2+/Co2+ transporter CorC